MGDILEEIVAYKQKEVEKFKKELSQVFLESRVEILSRSEMVSMKLALKNSTSGIIAEFKRKSPSKGWIARNASPEKTAYSWYIFRFSIKILLSMNINSIRPRSVVPLPYYSLPLVSVRTSAGTSSTKLTN